jgi:hypothetical protein
LQGWLATQLRIDHPALGAPPPTDRTELTHAAALLGSRLILPILDGLDEIQRRTGGRRSAGSTTRCGPGQQIVVTSRSQQYRDSVRPQGGLDVTLRAAAAVQLRPLNANVVRTYLADDEGSVWFRAWCLFSW